MRRRLLPLGLLLAAGCSPAPAPAPVVGTAPKVTAPSPASTPDMHASLPPGACTLEGYEAFFETFVGHAAERASLSAPGVDAGAFRIEMRDSTWVDPTKPGVALDVRETRDGDAFTAEAVPVERDENDEIVRRLGPPVRYRFRHAAGCWQYTGRD